MERPSAEGTSVGEGRICGFNVRNCLTNAASQNKLGRRRRILPISRRIFPEDERLGRRPFFPGADEIDTSPAHDRLDVIKALFRNPARRFLPAFFGSKRGPRSAARQCGWRQQTPSPKKIACGGPTVGLPKPGENRLDPADDNSSARGAFPLGKSYPMPGLREWSQVRQSLVFSMAKARSTDGVRGFPASAKAAVDRRLGGKPDQGSTRSCGSNKENHRRA